MARIESGAAGVSEMPENEQAEASGPPAPQCLAPQSQPARPCPGASPVDELVEYQPMPSYDGHTPAPGTTNPKQWESVDAPFTNGPGERSPEALKTAEDQFAVEHNDRYKNVPHDNGKQSTWCNIYVSDVTRALGAEVPHWVDKDGHPAKANDKNTELSADATKTWFHQHGEENGYHPVSAREAQEAANRGQPTVVIGHGHEAMVRPGTFDERRGPTIAQAGATRHQEARVNDGWPAGERQDLEYWVHDDQPKAASK